MTVPLRQNEIGGDPSDHGGHQQCESSNEKTKFFPKQSRWQDRGNLAGKRLDASGSDRGDQAA